MTEPGGAAGRPVDDAAGSRGRWAGLLLVVLVLVGFRGLLGYEPAGQHREVLEGAERFFFSPADGNPRLIFALTVLLLYQRRRGLLEGSSGPLGLDLALGLGLGVPALGLALWSTHVAVPELLVPALSLLLLAGAVVFSGVRGLRAMVVPALFLMLAWRPPGVLVNAVIHPMQVATAATTAAVFDLFGQQAAAQGDLVVANGHVFHVIETCAGVRSILTLVMASVVYVEVMGVPRLRAVIVVLLSPLVALVANELRVIGMVVNPLSRFASVHTLQGVVMIVCGVLALAGIDRLLARTLLPGVRGYARGPIWPDGPPASARLRFGVLVSGVALLAAGTAAVPVWTEPAQTHAPLHRLAHRLDGWRSTPLARDDEMLGSAHPSEWLYRAYAKDGREVTLLMAVDRRLDPRTSMLSDKQLLPAAGWSIVERHDIELPSARRGEEILLVSPEGETELAWWWTRHVGSEGFEIGRALLSLDRGPTRRSRPARLVEVRTAVDPDHPEAARAALRSLLAAALGDFESRGEGRW